MLKRHGERKTMRYEVTLLFKTPPNYTCTIKSDVVDEATAIEIAKKQAKDRGFKSKPKNVTTKEIN